MARFHGKNGKAQIGGSDQINEVQDWSLDINVPLADASAMGNAFTYSLPGQYSASVSINCSYDSADTDGQEAMVTALLAGSTVALKLWEKTPATGVKYWSGDFWVEKVGEKVPVGGRVERSFGLKLDGAITRGTEA